MRIQILVIALLLLIPTTAMANIKVEPGTMDLTLIAGANETRSLDITWEGDGVTLGFITTEISPDGEGVEISYSRNPVILYSGVTETVNMTIETAVCLAPDNYVIETKVFTNVEEYYEEINEIIEECDEDVEEIVEEIENLTEEFNETKERLNLTEELNQELARIIDDILELLEDIKQKIKEGEEKEVIVEKEIHIFPFLPSLLLGILISIGMALLIFLISRKNKAGGTKGEKKKGSNGPNNK